VHSLNAFNDRRNEKRALTAAQGKSKAPRGYKPDTATRTAIQTEAEHDLKHNEVYDGTPGQADFKVIEPKNYRKTKYEILSDDQDWKENPNGSKGKMEVPLITGRKKS